MTKEIGALHLSRISFSRIKQFHGPLSDIHTLFGVRTKKCLLRLQRDHLQISKAKISRREFVPLRGAQKYQSIDSPAHG